MFFDDDANFDRLLGELESWKHTPFVARACIKGSGVDCVQFAHQVLLNVGAISPAVFPQSYTIRGGGESMLAILEQAVATVPELERTWRYGYSRPHQITRGNLLLLSTGRALHHFAIVAKPPLVWHCLTKVGCASLADPSIGNHIFGVWRVR
jgi:cell wall-associated NlpC family hydrolase